MFSFTSIPDFTARGLRRCVVPGTSTSFSLRGARHTQALADFWQGKEGAVLMRVSWIGYCWSFSVHQRSGMPIPDESASMQALAVCMQQELFRWMTEDAADEPPFGKF